MKAHLAISTGSITSRKAEGMSQYLTAEIDILRCLRGVKDTYLNSLHIIFVQIKHFKYAESEYA